jgi:hypothetical protein
MVYNPLMYTGWLPLACLSEHISENLVTPREAEIRPPLRWSLTAIALSAGKPLPNASAAAATRTAAAAAAPSATAAAATASAAAAAAAASCARGRELGGANALQTKREPPFRLPHLLTQTLGT